MVHHYLWFQVLHSQNINIVESGFIGTFCAIIQLPGPVSKLFWKSLLKYRCIVFCFGWLQSFISEVCCEDIKEVGGCFKSCRED
ncbi:unnamed protein product [Linum tenue]|uniref:Uncharacterized protein n=1 Tax=Linum tenue TaxID=586396 RepID=A0AAV0Q2G7_9ROSI|nr:unnamed protein product [Linum tenue]